MSKTGFYSKGHAQNSLGYKEVVVFLNIFALRVHPFLSLVMITDRIGLHSVL